MLLNNVRVLDLSQYIPGPYLSRMLADLGAQIIKIEPPDGDPMRRFNDSNQSVSPVYNWLNRGKKIARINLKSKQGAVKLKQLIAHADILIDGFRPGILDRLGFGRLALEIVNPRLINCAITGFGQTGPYAQQAGHDLGYCAVAGVLSSSYSGQRRQIVFPPLADHVGSLQACNTILAALYAREKTGKGAYIDASLYEPLLSWNYLIDSQHISLILGGSAAYYNIYKTADNRFITLSALEEKFWVNFCQAIGKENWIPRHADPLPQTELTTQLGDLFKTDSQQHWSALLKSVDCCYEPIPLIGEIKSHPHTRFRKNLDHYPNTVNDQLLSSDKNVNEVSDVEKLFWA